MVAIINKQYNLSGEKTQDDTNVFLENIHFLRKILTVKNISMNENFINSWKFLNFLNDQLNTISLKFYFYLFVWGFTLLSTLYRSYHDG